MEESTTKDAEVGRRHGQAPCRGHFAQNTGLIRGLEVNDLGKEIKW